MFAPPQHVKTSNKNSSNASSQTDSKNKPTSRAYTRDLKSEEENELAEWSRPRGCWETAVEGDMGVGEWSAMNTGSQAKPESSQESLRSWPTTSLCSCLIESDPNGGLSKYLRQLKSLLLRNKAMNSSRCTPAMRYHHGNSAAFFRQGLASSAPSTLSVKRKTVGAYNYRGSSTNGSSSATAVSMIPCKNYNKLHKHNSFSDHQNCSRQAKLDNQHRSYSQGDIRLNHLNLPSTHKPEPVLCPWLTNKDDAKTLAGSKELVGSKVVTENETETIPDSDTPQTHKPETNHLDEKESPSLLTSQHSTMQEYVEKYYNASSRVSCKSTLPVIAEKDQRLVETIINYRHSSTKDRETAHKNRYMQLTATDIRRTTALLLKTSMNKSSAKQQRTVPYPDTEPIDPNESVMASVGVTLAQLMEPKTSTFRTQSKPEVVAPTNTKPVMHEGLPRMGPRWQIPRYQ